MSRPVGKPFKRGDPRTVRAGRKGGRRTAESRRNWIAPYKGSVLDLMTLAKLTEPSRQPWRVFWKAVYALPMGKQELQLYRRHTEREDPPTAPVREAVGVIGRRGGKSQNGGALQAVYSAISFDAARHKIAPGETVTVPLLAADRKQARQLINYVGGLCELPEVRPFVQRRIKGLIQFKTGVDVTITTASYRGTRGYTCPAVICDEISYWRTEDDAANPDAEILAALRPTMSTIQGALLLMLSSPFGEVGELYAAVQRAYGVNDPDTLVWIASSEAMHPGSDALRRDIKRMYAADPTRAASEFGSEGTISFRSASESFMEAAAVEACTVPGRHELPALPENTYAAFADASGGAKDSFTLGIAHREGDDTAVLDLLRETRPPFSTEAVVAEYCAVLRRYHCSAVVADKYAVEWVRQAFEREGIKLVHSTLPKSQIYAELLGPLNSGKVELLDHPRMLNQLLRLERKVGPGGRDRIDHAKRAKDDLINSAAGCLGLALGVDGRKQKPQVQWSMGKGYYYGGGGVEVLDKPPNADVEWLERKAGQLRVAVQNDRASVAYRNQASRQLKLVLQELEALEQAAAKAMRRPRHDPCRGRVGDPTRYTPPASEWHAPAEPDDGGVVHGSKATAAFRTATGLGG